VAIEPPAQVQVPASQEELAELVAINARLVNHIILLGAGDSPNPELPAAPAPRAEDADGGDGGGMGAGSREWTCMVQLLCSLAVGRTKRLCGGFLLWRGSRQADLAVKVLQEAMELITAWKDYHLFQQGKARPEETGLPPNANLSALSRVALSIGTESMIPLPPPYPHGAHHPHPPVQEQLDSAMRLIAMEQLAMQMAESPPIPPRQDPMQRMPWDAGELPWDTEPGLGFPPLPEGLLKGFSMPWGRDPASLAAIARDSSSLERGLLSLNGIQHTGAGSPLLGHAPAPGVRNALLRGAFYGE